MISEGVSHIAGLTFSFVLYRYLTLVGGQEMFVNMIEYAVSIDSRIFVSIVGRIFVSIDVLNTHYAPEVSFVHYV